MRMLRIQPIQRLLISCILSIVTVSAMALDQPFPLNVKRGTMSPASHPTIVVDGNMRRLTAGAQIRNQDNMIQMPATIINAEYAINYTENVQGEIDRIWILTALEASQPLRTQQPD